MCKEYVDCKLVYLLVLPSFSRLRVFEYRVVVMVLGVRGSFVVRAKDS